MRGQGAFATPAKMPFSKLPQTNCYHYYYHLLVTIPPPPPPFQNLLPPPKCPFPNCPKQIVIIIIIICLSPFLPPPPPFQNPSLYSCWLHLWKSEERMWLLKHLRIKKKSACNKSPPPPKKKKKKKKKYIVYNLETDACTPKGKSTGQFPFLPQVQINPANSVISLSLTLYIIPLYFF